MKPKDIPQPDFLHPKESQIVRALSPEILQDRHLARVADLVSLEALNPEDMTHDAMTEEQLTRWMQGDDRHMTRFLIVDPKDFDTHVDPHAFNQAIQEAKENGQSDHADALLNMKKNGVVGFTYLYNDAHRDDDFRRRAGVVREKEGVPENHSIWELNTWYVPGTGDTYVQRATADTLREFSKTLVREKTMVMFVDAGDLREAYEEAEGPITLRELSRRGQRTTAESALQDTRVLRLLGFHFLTRVRYDDEKPTLDFAYARRIEPQQ